MSKKDRREPYLERTQINDKVYDFKYSYDFGSPIRAKITRPFGVSLISVFIISLSLVLLCYLGLVLLANLKIELPFTERYIGLVKGYLGEPNFIEFGILAFVSICVGILVWDGSKSGLFFGLVLMMWLSVRSAYDLWNFEFYSKSLLGSPIELTYIYYYLLFKLTCGFLLMLYLYKYTVMQFFKSDGSELTLSLFAAFLLSCSFIFGELWVK